MNKEFSEYIYLNDDGTIYGTSRNIPMKYEDQTDCIVIHSDNEYDLDRLLDMLIPNEANSVNKSCGSTTIEDVLEHEGVDSIDDLSF